MVISAHSEFLWRRAGNSTRAIVRDSPPVAIVSTSLARRYFPGENPIGRKLIVATPGQAAIEVTREIVGVAGDVRYLTRPGEESLEIYLPYAQTTWPNIYVIIRTTGDPSSLAPELRAVLRDPAWNRQSIGDLTTMQARISALNDKPRLNSLLAALFAGIALLLAGVGIYGVVSYSTLRRAQEIGIRMALGATPPDIVRWILGQALLLTIAGLALGLLGHLALSRALCEPALWRRRERRPVTPARRSCFGIHRAARQLHSRAPRRPLRSTGRAAF